MLDNQKQVPNLTHKQVAIRLFLTCWIIYSLHFATNTVREIYPALSLGDHLSFDVSEYLGMHPDIFELPGRGVFINNNPGASILGAIPYTLTRPVIDIVVNRVQQIRAENPDGPPEYNSIYPMAREFYQEAYRRGYDIKFGLAAGVMQALLMAPHVGIKRGGNFLYSTGANQTNQDVAHPGSALCFRYSRFLRTAQLNHNLLQSHFALFAFALLWRPWSTSKSI